jgi:ketosteroid isomerase-like protein
VSSEDVEIARAGYEALSSGDIDTVLEFFHPEFEVTTPASLSAEPDTYRGHDGVRRYFASFYEVMDDIRFEPDEFHEVGDRVVVEFTLRARGKSTGIDTEQKAVHVWELRGRRAIGLEVYPTLDEAIAAARNAA